MTRTHIVLGDRVKCRITGFVGIVTARTDWIFGCVRWGVQREEMGEKGEVLEPWWADDDQLELVERNVVLTPALVAEEAKPRAAKPRKPGGPDRGESLDDPPETG